MYLREILDILNKYQTQHQRDYPVWAEHDILGFNVDYEKISEEDKQTLEEYGVFYDVEYNSLIRFV